MNPLLRMRLGHPKEVALHVLDRMLFPRGQHKAQLVSHHGSGRGVIRTIAAARARLAIHGMLLPRGQKRRCDRRQEGRAFVGG
jgi:hypothetical protein